jgi:hypothetical protein
VLFSDLAGVSLKLQSGQKQAELAMTGSSRYASQPVARSSE